VSAGQPRQDPDAAVEQLAVGRVGRRLGLDRGVDGDAPQVPLLDGTAALRELCRNLGDAVIRRRSVLACW